ncbi:MAG: DUF370 domain-containing protein [Clostridia bacterium]|nr:DUF370 domain-containing protein [Clostridia bacterium]
MKFVNIGFNNMLLDQRIVAVVSPDSAPAKRIVAEAKENMRIIDCTGGRRTKCVIITDSDHVVLCALSAEVLASRLNDNKNDNNGEEK